MSTLRVHGTVPCHARVHWSGCGHMHVACARSCAQSCIHSNMHPIACRACMPAHTIWLLRLVFWYKSTPLTCTNHACTHHGCCACINHACTHHMAVAPGLLVQVNTPHLHKPCLHTPWLLRLHKPCLHTPWLLRLVFWYKSTPLTCAHSATNGGGSLRHISPKDQHALLQAFMLACAIRMRSQCWPARSKRDHSVGLRDQNAITVLACAIKTRSQCWPARSERDHSAAIAFVGHAGAHYIGTVFVYAIAQHVGALCIGTVFIYAIAQHVGALCIGTVFVYEIARQTQEPVAFVGHA